MKRLSSSLWWLVAILLLSPLLVACERPLQDESDLEALTPGAGATVSPPSTTPGGEATAFPGTQQAPSPTAAGEATPAGEEPTGESTAPAPTATPVPEETEERTAEIIHVVVAGDTLFSLAQQYGVTVEEIAAANNMSNIHSLEVGQELVIPPPGGETTTPATEEPPTTEEPPATEERVHVVQPGENLYRIGLQYGFTIEELAAYNNIANPNRLEVGQEIRIPPEGWSP